ncbi:monooxygenase [Aurantiacibacter xanthus]|uniref:Monooxygenase n=1 Tax=Aurantiacibacter xanthus TaxID=1784712 RepID=A0A3A1P6J9_9SPHN|nr:FAD-dependent oxidoreductase [Aurantiacibacter xanthus]RIV89443.1 monooxygenase [Aurantiacibacter xanthus]
MSLPIVIVGAGPVGLCLAIDLAMRGVEVTVVDTRHPREIPTVRCNHVSSRTMETFRRMGIAGKVREAGLPDDYPNDIVFRPVATREEFARIHIPSRRDRFSDTGSPDAWWPTPEPPHRCNQIFFEPLLFDRAASLDRITILNRTSAEAFTQGPDSVTLSLRDLDTGRDYELEGAYLVGCDGGRSMVRKGIGARLQGDAEIQKVQSTYFRSAELAALIPGEPGWMTYLYHPERAGNLLAINGIDTWLLHNYLLPGESDFDAVDRDGCLRMVLGVGPEFEYEFLACEDWIGRRLVADSFRDRRVFLAGDSAHLWVPYAGYGMNAGIADAMDLSWQLAACVQGWGGEAMLEGYVAERKPITEQVSRFAMNHAGKAIAERTTIPGNFLDETPAAQEARAALGREAERLHVQQFACAGLNFGYFYDQSPLIAYDGSAMPAYTMADYTPSTVPGCRAAHFWLADGRSLYDALGQGYTLLRRDADVAIAPLVATAQSFDMPLEVLDLAAEQVPGCYEHGLLIVRPDQHVAWRGNALPDDVEALVKTLCGHIAVPASE